MKINRVFTALVASFLATPALAAPVAVDFVGKSTSAGGTFMTGDADGILNLQSMWEPVEGDGAMAGLHGPCFGAARMAGGVIAGNGYCAFKDAMDQTVLIHWWMENAKSPAGVWAIVGGTGKWATASGGGLFVDMPGEDDAMNQIHITGMVDVK